MFINTGGSMTGGSLSKSSTGIIGRSREIDELRLSIAQLTERMKVDIEKEKFKWKSILK